MDRREFENFVLKEAMNLLNELKETQEQLNLNEEVEVEYPEDRISPGDVWKMAQDIKAWNIELQMDTPVIQDIINENRKKKYIQEQKTEVDQSKLSRDRMKKLSKFQTPSDEDR